MCPKKESVTSEIRLLGLNALSTLVNLNPPLTAETRNGLYDKILPLLKTEDVKPAKDDKPEKFEAAAVALAVMDKVVD
jgi:hypothetical protein